MTSTKKTPEMQTLASFLAPRNIAVIGASDDPTRIGGRPISYLLQSGYKGRVIPVNPTRNEVQGLRAYASIGEVEGGIDCAIIALPAPMVLDAARECARHGVRSALVFSSGFGEMGAEGMAAQQELTQLAQASGMRIVGPNMVGAYNAVERAFMTFSGAVAPVIPKKASRVSIVSQSGGFAGYVLALAQERDLTFGKWITTGNEADVDVSEVISWLAQDEETDVILAYIEGIKRGDRFIEAVEMARAARKPVVVLKVGRTAAGAEAAASHTASLAGSDEVFNAVCRQYGVHRALSAEEMLDVAIAAAQGQFPEGNRMGVLTVSGGIGVQIADLADDHGLALPQVPEDAQRRLTEIVPFASPRNPVDITAQFTNDPSILERSIDVLFETECYDTAILFLGHAAAFPTLAQKFAEAVGAARRRYPDRILAVCALGTPEILDRYRDAGCLVFSSPGAAVSTLAALAKFAAVAPRPHHATASGYPQGNPRNLNELDAKAYLADYGICSPGDRLALTPSEAASLAAQVGFPVAVKVLSPDLLHKSDAGGVALALTTSEAVREAGEAILRNVALRAPGAQVDGLMVGPMLCGGVECIVGLHRDPVFGPVMMFGLGGTAVELLHDVSFRVGPIDQAEALSMIRETRCFPLLNGFRGAPTCDLDALSSVLARLSKTMCEPDSNLLAVEINPLLVMTNDRGAFALDAVVTIAETLP